MDRASRSRCASPAPTGTTRKKPWPWWMRFPRCMVNGGDRGSGRIVCSGMGATMRLPFGAVSGLVTSCPCWPCVAPAHGSGLGRWRWVVERTFAWLSQFRRLRVRYDRRRGIPLARVRADLLAVAAQDVEERVSGWALLRRRSSSRRWNPRRCGGGFRGPPDQSNLLATDQPSISYNCSRLPWL
jgi:Transposase DDE domain